MKLLKFTFSSQEQPLLIQTLLLIFTWPFLKKNTGYFDFPRKTNKQTFTVKQHCRGQLIHSF